MSVFETGWAEDMTEEEGVELVKRAILAGIFNDLGSGSNVDVCVLRMDGTMVMDRGAVKPNDEKPLRAAINRSDKLIMRSGTTSILKSEFKPHAVGGVTIADVTVTDVAMES